MSKLIFDWWLTFCCYKLRHMNVILLLILCKPTIFLNLEIQEKGKNFLAKLSQKELNKLVTWIAKIMSIKFFFELGQKNLKTYAFGVVRGLYRNITELLCSIYRKIVRLSGAWICIVKSNQNYSLTHQFV